MSKRSMVRRRRVLHLRAAFIALHCIIALLLSLPNEGLLGNERRWNSPTTQKEMAVWATKLTAWGMPVTGAELKNALHAFALKYLHARRRVAAPLQRYGEVTGAVQGWAMFASPRRVPTELVVQIQEGKGWRKIFIPRSAEHDYRKTQLGHNRVRKMFGQLGRGRRLFMRLARWIAIRALQDHPQALVVRVTLHEFHTLPPERVRAGHQAKRKRKWGVRFGRSVLR